MPAMIRTVNIRIIVRLSGCELSQRQVSRNNGVSQCAIPKALCRVHETSQQNTQRPREHPLKMETLREDCVLLINGNNVTGVTLVKLPYAQESRQQDPVSRGV